MLVVHRPKTSFEGYNSCWNWHWHICEGHSSLKYTWPVDWQQHWWGLSVYILFWRCQVWNLVWTLIAVLVVIWSPKADHSLIFLILCCGPLHLTWRISHLQREFIFEICRRWHYTEYSWNGLPSIFSLPAPRHGGSTMASMGLKCSQLLKIKANLKQKEALAQITTWTLLY